LIVVQLGYRAWPVGFESINLWQIRGVNQQQSRARPHQRGSEHEQAKQDPAYQLPPGHFYGWKIFIDQPHGEMRSG
jgi:hypothetical protein